MTGTGCPRTFPYSHLRSQELDRKLTDPWPELPPARTQPRPGHCTGLLLALMAGCLLAGCRASPPPSPQPGDALAPTGAATESPIRVPTFTPRPVTSPTPIPLSSSLDVPTTQETPDSVPLRKFVGVYTHLTENWEGQVRLEVKGSAVYATFQTVRSPVQYFARAEPAILFTVPAGFRPAVPLTWDVIGQHVGTEGEPEPARREMQVFHLQVDTEGHVRYVDDAGVNGVSYLRYATRLSWPLAGTDPQVCRRNEDVHRQILAALHERGETVASCAKVTWAQLLAIRAVPSPLRGQMHGRDLVGLSNLTTLHLQTERQATLPPDLLAHTPRLTQFSLDAPELTALPATLLAFTPLLEDLKLDLDLHTNVYQMPSQLLRSIPLLRRLEINVTGNSRWPKDFLTPVPQLTHLAVSGPRMAYWVAQWMDRTPHLTHLIVNDWHFDSIIPEDFLAPVPHLKLLDLRSGSKRWLIPFPEGFLRHTPHLESLTLGLHDALVLPSDLCAYTRQLTDVTLDFGELLSHLPEDRQIVLPNLTHLSLNVRDLRTIHEDFLLSVPRLTHPTLTYTSRFQEPLGLTLPENFLARVPQLQSLTIDVGQLDPIPVDLLAYTPHLRAFALSDSRSEGIPQELLQSMPELEELSLSLPAVTDIPPDLLAAVPKLGQLDFSFDPRITLPSEFLAAVSLLEELEFHAESVPFGFLEPAVQLKSLTLSTRSALPEGFLANTPSLESLDLVGQDLPSVPEGFLSDPHQLKYLRLQLVSLQALPDNFLARAPALEVIRFDRKLAGIKEPADGWQIGSLPSGFLVDAPRLESVTMFLDTITRLPNGFLQNSPHLRGISLRTFNLAHIPSGFLANTPHLQWASLDLGHVAALAERSLTTTPRLETLYMTARSLQQVPNQFLVSTPNLKLLWLSTQAVPAWPDGFLGAAPRLEEISIIAPTTAAQLGSHHPLWPTLARASKRVVVTTPNPPFTVEKEYGCDEGYFVPTRDSPLLVLKRETDANGITRLKVMPWHSVFVYDYSCPIWIDTRYTQPTVS